jgi:hypothetical protein
MIEGLKVTVNADELRGLCIAQASFHRERAIAYAENLKNLEDAEIEGMQYSGGDPKNALRDKQSQHENSANELRFIADHLKAGEEYLLDQSALMKLGIARSSNGFW